jgi:transposase
MVEEALQPGVTVVGVAAAHGVNPDQLFHWRKQYRHGMLEVGGSPHLLPVTVSDRGTLAKSLPAASPSSESLYSGTIHVELKQGQLRIAGQADPAALRVVLECLLG